MPSWPFYHLDTSLPTDRADDEADYEAVFGPEILADRPFINIGAGDWTHPLWSNLDFVQPPYDKYTPPRYNVDLSKLVPLTIPDESIYLAFTSHTIEHLTTEMLRYWFKEVYRILAPGGVFRLVMPEIETAYWAYLNGDMRYFDHRYNARFKSGIAIMNFSQGFGVKYGSLERAFLARFASCLGNPRNLTTPDGREASADEAVRAYFDEMPAQQAFDDFLSRADFARKKPNQHINWFTGERLQRLLREAGFEYTIRNSYGQSVCPLMRNKVYFDRTRPNESLYVDAVKLHPDVRVKWQEESPQPAKSPEKSEPAKELTIKTVYRSR